MFTKENTKIFIDTNIFLGLYNSNEAGNVKIFLHSLFKNKSILITTEQAINEYQKFTLSEKNAAETFINDL